MKMPDNSQDHAAAITLQTVYCSDISRSFRFYDALLMAASETRPSWKRISARAHLALVRLADGTERLFRLQQDKDAIVHPKPDEPIEADGMPASFLRLPLPNPEQTIYTFFLYTCDEGSCPGESLGTLGYGSIPDPDGQAVCVHKRWKDLACRDPDRTNDFYRALVPRRAMRLFGRNLLLDDGTWIEFCAEPSAPTGEPLHGQPEAFALKIADTFEEANRRLQQAKFHDAMLLIERGLDPNATVRMTTDPDGRPVIVRQG